jgi:mono/diheme cytochrome c family protein
MRFLIIGVAAAWLVGCDCSLATGCDDTLFSKPADTSAPDATGFAGVVQIFNENCVSCHPGTDTFPDLETDLCGALVNVESSGYGPDLLVVPNSAEDSVLWHKLEGTDGFAGTMPLGGDQLSQPRRDVVKDWINDGATCGDDTGGRK